MRSRIQYIDTMKGIAVILVLLFHTISMPEQAACMINTLHNSTFYMASGLLLPLSNIAANQKNFFCSKIKSLMYPFVLWVIIYSAFFPLFGNNMSLYNRILECINRLWFLPVLFAATLIVYLCNKCMFSKSLTGIICFSLCFLLGLFSSQLGKIGFYTFITWIGFSITYYPIKKPKMFLIIIIYSITSYFLFFYHGGYIKLSDTVVSGLRLNFFLVASILGALTVLSIAKNIPPFLFLQWIGKNSLYYYVIHFLSLDLKNFLITYSPELTPLFTIAYGSFTFLLALLIPTIYIICLKERNINKLLFGK